MESMNEMPIHMSILVVGNENFSSTQRRGRKQRKQYTYYRDMHERLK